MLVLGVISRYSGIWWLLVQNVRLHLANIYASVAMWLYRWQLVVCWVHAYVIGTGVDGQLQELTVSISVVKYRKTLLWGKYFVRR